MKLVIAEKNEAARDIAAALCGPSRAGRLPAEGNGYAVCAASGHLLSLMEPAAVDEAYAKTDIEDLPIVIYPWPCGVEGKYQRDKLEQIRRYLESPALETIYHAGDADDEGQLIVDEILEHFGVNPADGRVMRAYVNDNIEKNIRRAFEQATPNAEHVMDGKMARARQLADFCFGVNESRLATGRLQAHVSVGRVQTPTLGLVVERDRARAAHSERTYYTLKAVVDGNTFTYKPPAEALEDGKHCFDRPFIEGIAKAIEGASIAYMLEHAEKAVEPPLPFEMTTLTADMSRRYGMTADDVMNTTQSLRDDHKAITYNRTDSPYLKHEHFVQAPDVAGVVMRNVGVDVKLDFEREGRAFCDEKAPLHHGIIPQEKPIDLSVLNDKERAVYEAVALRYLAQFMGQARYLKATAEFTVAGVAGTFAHESYWEKDAGWTANVPESWSRVKIGGTEGDAPTSGEHAGYVEASGIEEGKTTPPPAFTDGTLMTAMANIVRYVKDPEVKRVLKEKDEGSPSNHGSIGTAATRKDIIEKLVARGFLERRGKKLVSTEKGRRFYDVVPAEIKGVDLTAKWFLMQRAVAEGAAAERSVMDSVVDEFNRHKESAYVGVSLRESAGACPLCGQAVEKRGRSWACASNKSKKADDGTWEEVAGCGFKVFPLGGKQLTKKQVQSLIAGKDVTVRGCVSKSGNKGDWKVRLDAHGKIVFADKDFGRGATAASRRASAAARPYSAGGGSFGVPGAGSGAGAFAWL